MSLFFFSGKALSLFSRLLKLVTVNDVVTLGHLIFLGHFLLKLVHIKGILAIFESFPNKMMGRCMFNQKLQLEFT